MHNSTTAIILAAGKGTRMKAPETMNKVVFTLGHKPMIRYTVNTIKACEIPTIIVVVGYAKESVIGELKDEVLYAHQDNPQGTGHAVKIALSQLPENTEQVIVMYGDDSAFYTKQLIDELMNTHLTHHNDLTLVSINRTNPFGLGRILRNTNNSLIGVVEEKNATEQQKQITEINTGLYCFKVDFLRRALEALTPNPVTKEYYLTDTIVYACNNGYKAEALLWQNQDIWHGVNTPEELNAAEERMKQKNAVQ